ncbi:MAG: hypothetical protein AAGD11_12200 [Planctomycetota bacterium]
MKTVFALATGRSGTRFLSHLLRHNLRNAVCRHEPYFDWGNPSMFGRPIYDRTHGQLASIRHLLEKKTAWIDRQRADTYIETSHAFLKSYFDLAADYFPSSKFVHLIRHPLKTARSETNRELWVDSTHFPWRRYRADDGRKLFNWSLTGDEPIYKAAELCEPSLFQFYVIQWIEIENRAMRFLDQFDKHADCVTVHSPHELNDRVRVKAAAEQLGLELAGSEIHIEGKQNRTPGKKTTITNLEEDEFRQVVAQLPDEYLEIFKRAPYVGQDWSEWLLK